jgi:hypothetical protein
MNIEEVVQLLLNVKALEVFTYDYYDNDPDYGNVPSGTPHMSSVAIKRKAFWPSLGNALRTQKRSLWGLHLEEDITDFNTISRHSATQDFLQDLDQLEELTISAHLLIARNDGIDTLRKVLPATLIFLEILTDGGEPPISSAASIACLKDVTIPSVLSEFTWVMWLFLGYARLHLSTASQDLHDAGIRINIKILVDYGEKRNTTIKTLREWESNIDEPGWSPNRNGDDFSDNEESDDDEADTISNEHEEDMGSDGLEEIVEETVGDS